MMTIAVDDDVVCLFFLDFRDSKAVDSADGFEAAIAVGIPRQRSTELATRDCGGGCGAHLQLTAKTTPNPCPPEPRLRVRPARLRVRSAKRDCGWGTPWLAYARQNSKLCRPVS